MLSSFHVLAHEPRDSFMSFMTLLMLEVYGVALNCSERLVCESFQLAVKEAAMTLSIQCTIVLRAVMFQWTLGFIAIMQRANSGISTSCRWHSTCIIRCIRACWAFFPSHVFHPCQTSSVRYHSISVFLTTNRKTSNTLWNFLHNQWHSIPFTKLLNHAN